MLNITKKSLNVFWKFHSHILKKNILLKNKYQGETCYIFGNGGSIKYFDFSKFNGNNNFITSWGLLNSNLKNINFNYCIIPDQYNLYPLRLNRENHKINFNYERSIWKSIIKNHNKSVFITSLTNYYSNLFRSNQVLYYYSTNKNNKYENNLHANFNYDEGSLDVMIGLVKYMGFSKAVLIGCDYLGSPKLEGHFYSDADPFIGNEVHSKYISRIKKITEGLEIELLLPSSFKGIFFKHIKNIKNYNIHEHPKPQKNFNLLSNEDIDKMKLAGEKNRNIFI